MHIIICEKEKEMKSIDSTFLLQVIFEIKEKVKEIFFFFFKLRMYL